MAILPAAVLHNSGINSGVKRENVRKSCLRNGAREESCRKPAFVKDSLDAAVHSKSEKGACFNFKCLKRRGSEFDATVDE